MVCYLFSKIVNEKENIFCSTLQKLNLTVYVHMDFLNYIFSSTLGEVRIRFCSLGQGFKAYCLLVISHIAYNGVYTVLPVH